MCGLKCNKFFNVVLSMAGIGLSAYAFYVEKKSHENENYVPMCDINQEISCSKVFNSEFGRGFGLVGKYLGDDHPANQPNSLYGIVFYSFMLLMSLFNRRMLASLQILFSLGACGMSCYLGYLLYFVLKDLCVVCVATYAVNFLQLLFSLGKRRLLTPKVIKEDKYGYYIPTTNYGNSGSNNNNFKKYI